ncbi:MAG: hypothetical protein MUD08_05390 [Cytophagales bacterium]|jgi:hypothetical protein|nr:hypothetical protein [Cytophagales bacterium]
MKKHWLVAALLLIGCTGQEKPESQTVADSTVVPADAVATDAEAQKQPLVVNLIADKPRLDSTETPYTRIKLLAGEEEVWSQEFMGEGSALEKSNYGSYQIPDAATVAYLVFWAGSGDVLYLTQENDRWLLKHAETGEGTEEGEPYQYKTLKEVSN